jgi:hypothetical protein
MGRGLPSFDKEGMPGSDSRPRQGWLESARDCQSAAFLDHPVLGFVSATPLIRGGEFKSPRSQGHEQFSSIFSILAQAAPLASCPCSSGVTCLNLNYSRQNGCKQN